MSGWLYGRVDRPNELMSYMSEAEVKATAQAEFGAYQVIGRDLGEMFIIDPDGFMFISSDHSEVIHGFHVTFVNWEHAPYRFYRSLMHAGWDAGNLSSLLRGRGVFRSGGEEVGERDVT